MKKSSLALSLVVLAAFTAPAQATSYATAAQAKQDQPEHQAKKGAKKPKAPKKG